ncbi:MAG: hypothetical protein U0903_22165 [Planctomycetales bacterium]
MSSAGQSPGTSFTQVGGAIAVGVLEVGDFAGECDDDAFLPGEQAGDEEKFVGEDV